MEAVAGFLGAFFILGGFWFWVTAAVFFFVVLAFAENERNFLAGISIALFTWGVLTFNQLAIDWSTIPWFILGYMVIGAIWASAKWFLFLYRRNEKYIELKFEFADKQLDAAIVENTNMKELLDKDQWKNWTRHLHNRNFITSEFPRIIPLAKESIEKLIGWILWWPTSMFWTLLNDPLVRFAKWIVRRLSTAYDAMANKIFANAGVGDNDDLRY